MLQVAQTLGMIVGMILLQDRHVILQQILRLLLRQFGVCGFFEYLGERSQLLSDFAFGLVGAQPLDGILAVEEPFGDFLAAPGPMPSSKSKTRFQEIVSCGLAKTRK